MRSFRAQKEAATTAAAAEWMIIGKGAQLLLTMYALVIVELRGAAEYLGISLAPCMVLLHGGGSPKAALAKGVAPLLS